MSTFVCSAPGKIIVAGEYAVLDGAPAIAMAVNRRANVTVVANEGNAHSVSAPGFAPDARRFEVAADGLNWCDGGAGIALLDCVWRCAGVTLSGSYSFTLDSSAFGDPASGQKLGIGSSAAVCVALVAALASAAHAELDIESVAMRAHREFQGGHGSGADIACSLYGGLIEYRRCDASRSTVRPRHWPDGLEFAALWSGVPADSAAKLAALGSKAQALSRAALGDAAETLAVLWESGDLSLRAISDYVEALRAFDADHSLGIFEAGHDRLLALASAAGVVYKPCGAGGGDLGLVFATDAERIDVFAGEAERRGFLRMDMHIDTLGVASAGQPLAIGKRA